MSWWARSLVNSLRGGDDDEEEEFEQEKEAITKISNSNEKSLIGSRSRAQQEEGEVDEDEAEEGGTPTRGVKEDLSELTKTLTLQFWGVASFLAPAPPYPGAAESDRAVAGLPDEAAPPLDVVNSPRIDGIRNDFAEIGGRFKSGISSVLSHTKAVSEISKIASSLLPFGSDDEEAEDDGAALDAVGVNEEVLAFARNVAMHPETWLDFPLPHAAVESDDFEMSDVQLEHALAIERLAPEFAALRAELCPSQISEDCFWKIYFVLLQSRLNRHDAELLSTPQIVEARAILLQDMHSQAKLGAQMLQRETSYSKEDVTAIPIEENVMGPSSTVNANASPKTLSYGEPASDPAKNIETEKHAVQTIAPDSTEDIATEKHPVQIVASDSAEDVETEKHPVQTTEVKIVDKSVIEEEPANHGVSNDISIQAFKEHDQRYEEDGDGWLEDDNDEASSARGAAISLGQEEDVSFSDLEVDDDDDQGPTTSSKTVSVDSRTGDSRGWVQLNKDSVGSVKGDNSTDPKAKESNDWLDIEDIDME